MYLFSTAEQAFVIRFDDAVREHGKVEHIASGQHLEFRSLGQLLDFLRSAGPDALGLDALSSEPARAGTNF